LRGYKTGDVDLPGSEKYKNLKSKEEREYKADEGKNMLFITLNICMEIFIFGCGID